MKVYVASSVNNREVVIKWIDVINNTPDLEITYDWATHGKILDPQKQREISIQEVKGAKEADLILVLLPGGWGTHVEFGIGLGLNKPIFLVSLNEKPTDYMDPDGKTCTFHEHPNVKKIRKHAIIDELKWMAHLHNLNCGGVDTEHDGFGFD
jgi:hypothetical protein